MFALRLIASVLCVLLIGAGCSPDPSEKKTVGEITGKGDPRFWELSELTDRHFRTSTELSQNQLDDLSAIETHVTLALVNNDTSLLRKCVYVLTNKFQNVKKWKVPHFEDGLYRRFHKDVITGELFQASISLAELEERLAFNLELTILLGQVCLRSDDYGYRAASVDGHFTTKLKVCELHYRATGQQNYTRIIEKWTSRWTDYVESDVGASHLAACRMFDFQRERVAKIHDITMDDALKAARSLANGLINGRYTPKWLEREFPLTPNNRFGATDQLKTKKGIKMESKKNIHRPGPVMY